MSWTTIGPSSARAPGPITSVGVLTADDDLRQPLQSDDGDVRLSAD